MSTIRLCAGFLRPNAVATVLEQQVNSMGAQEA
jgi:hypothetical protein